MENKKSFDNSSLLKRANEDREEYYAELEREERKRAAEAEANREWEERKQRDILDLEDQINALEGKNRFMEREIRSLLSNQDDPDEKYIDILRDKISQNEYSIYKLRCDIDDVRYKKRLP